MGGRYGGNDDGSSEYQDRRPDAGERTTEQQTIAEAVQAVADRMGNDHDGGGRTGSGHPLTRSRDSVLAEYLADKLTDSAEKAVEEADPDE
ncbi:hypothetical protein [Halocatena halophila]|uniref:hypothetical protein n=1 Tax=Halocatena halophila TaxID=2814576 RepID=UPI002ED390C6